MIGNSSCYFSIFILLFVVHLCIMHIVWGFDAQICFCSETLILSVIIHISSWINLQSPSILAVSHMKPYHITLSRIHVHLGWCGEDYTHAGSPYFME